MRRSITLETSAVNYGILFYGRRKKKANIIHYGSNRGRIISRSVLASDARAMILGFDYIFILHQPHFELLALHLLVEVCTDCKKVFNVISKDDSKTVVLLQIYILAPPESYARGQLSKEGSRHGEYGGRLKKQGLSTFSSIWRLMERNQLP